MHIKDLFEKVREENSTKFDNIPYKDKLSNYSDLCGLVYLDKNFNSTNKIYSISCAEHDKIYLSFDKFEDLTEKDVLYLLRCGIFYDEGSDSLNMFV